MWTNRMKSPDDHVLLLKERKKGQENYVSFVNFSFNFDSAAGIIYTVDVTKPKGEKITILKMADGKPFDENKTYKVALNSYRGNIDERGRHSPRRVKESYHSFDR